MKKFLLVALVGLGIIGMALAANAYTDNLNTCTSTYQLTGGSVTAAGWDTAIVRVVGAPTITVAKSAKNFRTGISDANMVSGRATDIIQFTMVWYNTGEDTADTVVLSDYDATGLTIVLASNGNTQYNCLTAVSYTAAASATYVITGANGSVGANAASGTFTFRATID